MIMVYSIFLYMLPFFDLRGESHENVKWRHTLYLYSCKVWLSFKVWFRRYRWKELSVSYLNTYIHTYILTNQVIESAIIWLKSVKKIHKWTKPSSHRKCYCNSIQPRKKNIFGKLNKPIWKLYKCKWISFLGKKFKAINGPIFMHS